jgi:hypothetical protein
MIAMLQPIIAMLVVTLTCGVSQAEEWVQVPGKDNEGYSLFVDPQSIIREKQDVVVMTLTEYPTPHRSSGNDYYSVKGQYEFDCSSPTKFRIGPFNEYREHGGKGIIIHGYDQWNEMWFDLTPEQILFKNARVMACQFVGRK